MQVMVNPEPSVMLTFDWGIRMGTCYTKSKGDESNNEQTLSLTAKRQAFATVDVATLMECVVYC